MKGLRELLNEIFSGYIEFLSAHKIADKELIQNFAKNKPNFVIGYNSSDDLSSYQPYYDLILVNVKRMVEISTISQPEITLLLLERAISEEISHAFLERVAPTYFETATLEEMAKTIFLTSKKEALAEQLSEKYLSFRGWPKKLLEILQRYERKEIQELFSRKHEESNFFENLSELAHFLKQEFNYTFNSAKRRIPYHVNDVYGKREREIYERILKSLQRIRKDST